jgi:hypothetical protein
MALAIFIIIASSSTGITVTGPALGIGGSSTARRIDAALEGRAESPWTGIIDPC